MYALRTTLNSSKFLQHSHYLILYLVIALSVKLGIPNILTTLFPHTHIRNKGKIQRFLHEAPFFLKAMRRGLRNEFSVILRAQNLIPNRYLFILKDCKSYYIIWIFFFSIVIWVFSSLKFVKYKFHQFLSITSPPSSLNSVFAEPIRQELLLLSLGRALVRENVWG